MARSTAHLAIRAEQTCFRRTPAGQWIWAHTCCLTNTQQFLEELPHQDRLSFTFEKESLQDKVAYLLDHKDAAIEMGLAVAEAYRRSHPPEEIALKMLDCAALSRLDNLAQSPASSQDYFVWPPKSL